MEELEESEGPFAFRRKSGVEYHEPSDEPWSLQAETKFPFMTFTVPPSYGKPEHCLGFSRRRVGRGGRVVIDRIPSRWDDSWSRGSDMDYSSDKSLVRPVTPSSLEEVVWDPYSVMDP